MKLRFYENADKSVAMEAGKRLRALASSFGAEIEFAGLPDVVVALGGDGTILRAIRENPSVPVLGLNLGSLGYLASVEEKDFESALASLLKGEYKIAERSMLEVGNGKVNAVAVNDVVIVREMSGHAAVMDVSVDGKRATRYMADGLIVATPTGSTAYSLSAGGPVLMPDTSAFVVTPMNPHALGIRPMVVRDDVRIEATYRSRGENDSERLVVYADGASVFMLGGDESAVICKSESKARIIELGGYDPYDVMARKLGWSGTNVK